MICRTCADAGDLAVSLSDMSSVRVGSVLRIKELHAKCRGASWCDCQHNSPQEVAPDA